MRTEMDHVIPLATITLVTVCLSTASGCAHDMYLSGVMLASGLWGLHLDIMSYCELQEALFSQWSLVMFQLFSEISFLFRLARCGSRDFARLIRPPHWSCAMPLFRGAHYSKSPNSPRNVPLAQSLFVRQPVIKKTNGQNTHSDITSLHTQLTWRI